eukprot:Em0007g320a
MTEWEAIRKKAAIDKMRLIKMWEDPTRQQGKCIKVKTDQVKTFCAVTSTVAREELLNELVKEEEAMTFKKEALEAKQEKATQAFLRKLENLSKSGRTAIFNKALNHLPTASRTFLRGTSSCLIECKQLDPNLAARLESLVEDAARLTSGMSIVATRLLNFILKNYFAFNNKHYQQISRVATGTPTFANFVIIDILDIQRASSDEDVYPLCVFLRILVTECKKKVIHPAGLSAPRSNLETVEEKAKALAKGKEEGKANQLSPTRVEANQSLLEPQGSTVVPFGKATTEQQEQWRALHMAFWKQRTEMAIAFEKENAEKSQPRGEETIRLLSKGLTFIPKPRIEKRVTLRRGVEDFIRKLRLKYVFRNRDKPVPELYRRTGYGPEKELITEDPECLRPKVRRVKPVWRKKGYKRRERALVMVLLLDTSKETERSIANYFPSKLKAVLGKLCIHTPPVDLCIFSIRFDLEARYGPRPLKKSTAVSMQEPLKEASPDWIGDDLIHNFAGVSLPIESAVTGASCTATIANCEPDVTSGPYNNPPRLAGGEIRNWGLLGGNGDGNIFSLSTYQCNGRETCPTRDTNPNPASSLSAGDESQDSQLGGAGRNAPLEGEAFVCSVGMLKMAGKLTTLLATEAMQEKWRALDVTFWKQRTEMAVSFEREIAEKASEEVDRHLDGTTKFLREANCTPLGLPEMWDGAQAESVKLAQHQLETAGSRKRGRGRKAELD